jgi:hypothetical protein
MTARTTPTPAVSLPRLLTEREAGEALGISPRQLESLRLRGGGPRFRKLGRRVYYTAADLAAWIDAAARANTADSHRGAA